MWSLPVAFPWLDGDVLKYLPLLFAFTLWSAAAPALADDQPAAAPAAPPAANATATATGGSNLDVPKLFATTCGWCHSQAGRKAGHGPQLMYSKRTDDYIRNRIRNGKEGAMPAFSNMFNDADIDRIIAYIRALRPQEDE